MRALVLTLASAFIALGTASAQTPPEPSAPPAYDPSLRAGGLAPPPPLEPSTEPAPSSPTVATLDRAKKEDSGRGLSWVYVNLEGGFQHVGLQTFTANEEELTAGLVATSSSGGMIGAGAGVQLLFLTLGVRARAGFFSDWQLFSVGPELGFHIPIGKIEPHFELGGGYTALGNLGGAGDVMHVRGFYGRAGGGLDYFLTPVLSLGGAVSWELLGLTRPGLSASDLGRVQDDPEQQANPEQARVNALKADGTSFGSALSVTAVVGLHF